MISRLGCNESCKGLRLTASESGFPDPLLRRRKVAADLTEPPKPAMFRRDRLSGVGSPPLSPARAAGTRGHQTSGKAATAIRGASANSERAAINTILIGTSLGCARGPYAAILFRNGFESSEVGFDLFASRRRVSTHLDRSFERWGRRSDFPSLSGLLFRRRKVAADLSQVPIAPFAATDFRLLMFLSRDVLSPVL